MANAKHLAILKKGVEVWNQWRRENPDMLPNLHGADLRGADLRGAVLEETQLNRAKLSGSKLSGAKLIWANLSGANLAGADLIGANLVEANLSGTVFNRAKLHDSNLAGADLRRAILLGADLSGTQLLEANFWAAMLSEADLTEANLTGVNFSGAKLNGAKLSGGRLSQTIFGSVDLSQVKGLENVLHAGPSTIGMDTIYQSAGNIPEKFLRGAGVPDQLIAYANSLLGKAIEYYSAFISHSYKDEEFAKRLFADLQSNNVRTWYAPEELKIGDKFRQKIDESIRLQDKLLLVLSEHSVTSDWVEHEVEAALAKESEQKKTVLFPVRVDNTVMEIKTGWPAHVKNTRHIGDFCHWKDHDAYQEAFERLLRDLKAAEHNAEV